MDMFYQDEGGGPGLPTETILSTAPRTSLTYEEVVRELITSEKAYIKELHMLIKVFRLVIIFIKFVAWAKTSINCHLGRKSAN